MNRKFLSAHTSISTVERKRKTEKMGQKQADAERATKYSHAKRTKVGEREK